MTTNTRVIFSCGLLLAGFLCGNSRSSGQTVETKPWGPWNSASGKVASDQLAQNAKQAVASALERLRRTRSYNHPDFPWAIRAKQMRGNTMDFVELLHRSEDGKGFDWVGKALQVTIAYSRLDLSVYLPCGVGPIRVSCEAMMVSALDVRLNSMDGDEVFLACKTLNLSVPGKLSESGFQAFAEAEARLSIEQRKQLEEDYYLSPEQKLLFAAFGDECADLLRNPITMSKTRRTVLALAEPCTRLSNGRFKCARVAIARFDKSGKVLVRFEGKDIAVESQAILKLEAGDDSQTIELQGTGGVRLLLPGIPAD